VGGGIAALAERLHLDARAAHRRQRLRNTYRGPVLIGCAFRHGSDERLVSAALSAFVAYGSFALKPLH
jgi:hypothetical protein